MADGNIDKSFWIAKVYNKCRRVYSYEHPEIELHLGSYQRCVMKHIQKYETVNLKIIIERGMGTLREI